MDYWTLRGKECEIVILQEKSGRGNYEARLHADRKSNFMRSEEYDYARRPSSRYYFDWDRMVAELNDWLKALDQDGEQKVPWPSGIPH